MTKQLSLYPDSQRIVIEIQKSNRPDTKSRYSTIRTFSDQHRDNAIKEFNRLKRNSPSYRFRMKVFTFQTIQTEVVTKIEVLK